MADLHNIEEPMQFKAPDIDKIICKDCIFRSKKYPDGAARSFCEVFPDMDKPTEIVFGGADCDYYQGENDV